MAFIKLSDLKSLLRLHYLTNICLAVSFLFLKNISPFCDVLFDSCTMDYRETEILFFTAVIIVFRSRKQGAVNLLPYISTACMFAKMGNVLLYFYSDPVYGILYVVCCILQLLLLPEPTYDGPENIHYFRGTDLQEELDGDKRVTWIIELYATWNPPSIEFASVFAELSAKYSLNNLKFGKVDLARNQDVADKYKINTSPFSKQLPTLILFRNGKEVLRRPVVNNSGKLVKFQFTTENIVSQFDLNNLYQECLKNPIKLKSITKKED